ncbi:MAG TPA: DUF4344 domain-containing metallopeptidase [Allosphingosinicella sp.]
MRKMLTNAGLALCLWSGLATGSAAAVHGVAPAQDAKAAEEEKRDEFILGNIVFVLFHEFGHALVSEFELPVLGREEDAVDRFATFLLTPEGGEDEESDPSTILIDSMRGWFAASERTELAEIEWWDEHGPDQQRAYQIACLLYGADPKKFGAMADEVKLPEARKESCPSEAESNSGSWIKVAKPHVLGDDEKPPKRIEVTYGPAGDYALERDLLKESELLEGVAAELTKTFRLPRKLTIAARKCGEPNAFWDSEAAEVQICYELLREYRELYDQQKR